MRLKRQDSASEAGQTCDDVRWQAYPDDPAPQPHSGIHGGRDRTGRWAQHRRIQEAPLAFDYCPQRVRVGLSLSLWLTPAMGWPSSRRPRFSMRSCPPAYAPQPWATVWNPFRIRAGRCHRQGCLCYLGRVSPCGPTKSWQSDREFAPALRRRWLCPPRESAGRRG